MMRAAMAARLTTGAVGVAMLGFGAWHLLTDSDLGRKTSIGKWLVGGVIVHDGILAPFVFACCAVAWRFAGPRLRRGLAVFLLAGGSVTIIALPSALRSGDNSNPTVTPLDYPRNLAIVLGGLVVCVLLYVFGGRLKDRRQRAVAVTDSESSSGAEMQTEPQTGTKKVAETETGPRPVAVTEADVAEEPAKRETLNGHSLPAMTAESVTQDESEGPEEPAKPRDDEGIVTDPEEDPDGQE